MDEVLIAFDNDSRTNLRTFFESCADDVRQSCACNKIGYDSLFPPHLTNDELVKKMENVKVCIVAAHGSHDCIFNEEGEEFISIRTTNYSLSDKFLYTVSCSTAIDLMTKLFSVGLKLYVGYKGLFKVGKNESVFMECAMSGINSFISGKNFGDSQKDMLIKFDNEIEELRKSNSFWDSVLLFDDRESLVFKGNSQITINDL